MKELPLGIHVVVQTLNLEISPSRLADYVKEFCKNACRTCRTIIFPHLSNQIILFRHCRFHCRCLSRWQTRTHCWRHKCFPVCPRAQHLLRTQKMFLILFRNILCPQQMFPSLRSMEAEDSFCVRRKHHEQQCVRNNVSSSARAFKLLIALATSFSGSLFFPFFFVPLQWREEVRPWERGCCLGLYATLQRCIDFHCRRRSLRPRTWKEMLSCVTGLRYVLEISCVVILPWKGWWSEEIV